MARGQLLDVQVRARRLRPHQGRGLPRDRRQRRRGEVRSVLDGPREEAGHGAVHPVQGHEVHLLQERGLAMMIQRDKHDSKTTLTSCTLRPRSSATGTRRDRRRGSPRRTSRRRNSRRRLPRALRPRAGTRREPTRRRLTLRRDGRSRASRRRARTSKSRNRKEPTRATTRTHSRTSLCGRRRRTRAASRRSPARRAPLPPA
mmetsp:Transcript_3323/g.13380  ORF Transcript_3323/g.13380 Transcript_3323/m.13380 type:complete len:202 (+) Transcript_3323:271-876(+)